MLRLSLGTPELSAIQTGSSSALVDIEDVRDIDKSRRVGTSDLTFVQTHSGSTTLLRNSTIPVAGSAEENANPPAPPPESSSSMFSAGKASTNIGAKYPSVDLVSIDDFFADFGKKKSKR